MLLFFFFFLFTVEASVHGSNVHCTDKTIEAAEALLHMESPTCLRDARSPGMSATGPAQGGLYFSHLLVIQTSWENSFCRDLYTV